MSHFEKKTTPANYIFETLHNIINIQQENIGGQVLTDWLHLK